MAATEALEFVREEDFVEYYLFPKLNIHSNEADTETILNNHLTEVNKIVEQYSKEYLWHKDEFKVISRINIDHIVNNENNMAENLPPHLYGITHYGDNVEDEWFIVFLLLEISKKINDLIIRTADSDGEFLLIESANFLPSWASPDTCTQRVYLYKGKLHIIPLELLPTSDDTHLNKMLEMIHSEPTKTEASTKIQKAVFERINGYPNKIKELMHRTKVYLPVGVANILNHKPNLIAPAILAFCDRDPIDMKACRAMKYFPPENRVYSSVQFTRCLYAMLTHSTYNPDRRIGWNLPNPNSAHHKSHLLGVKIACGFEILISQAKPSQDLENDKSWHLYLKQLNEKNYFREYIEHSKEYNNLLNKAKDYFKDHRNSMHYNPVLGQEILELTKKLECSYEELKKNEDNLPADDDDSWLDINPQELEQMLIERYGKNRVTVNGNNGSSDLTGKLTEFLDHISGYEGAEFPERPNLKDLTDSPPVRPQRGIKKKDKTKVSFSQDTKLESANTENSKMNFDPNNFTCAVQNILNLVIPEDNWDLESGSEMSEYGDESDMELDNLNKEKINSEMKQYMDEMDRELAKTTIGQSFEKNANQSDLFDDIEDFEPVNVDMTVFKNMLESYKSQMGSSGPTSNLLESMGVDLGASSSQKPDQ